MHKKLLTVVVTVAILVLVVVAAQAETANVKVKPDTVYADDWVAEHLTPVVTKGAST